MTFYSFLPNIDIFDTYRLVGIAQEVKKVPSFFKNRYFGTEVTFNEDKVLIKFNADNVSLEEVCEYVFHNLKVSDMKINELTIEDVVKNLLLENEKQQLLKKQVLKVKVQVEEKKDEIIRRYYQTREPGLQETRYFERQPDALLPRL